MRVRDEVPRLRRSRDDGVHNVDDLDEMSLAETATDLDGHGKAVGARGGQVAAAVGPATRLGENC